MSMLKIGSIENLDIFSGQIMGRVVAGKNEEANYELRVVVPKAITSEGVIDKSELPIEQLRVIPDEKRITQLGDIVIKLSTPYDSAIITEEFVGCVVPSFCAIIRNKSNVDTDYLQAFLSSKLCKEQLKNQVAGTVMTILTVGKIRDVEIPFLAKAKQQEVGAKYKKAKERLAIMKEIIELENKRNDVIFNGLVE